MSFLAAKAVILKSWIWLKAHWQIPFLLVWTVVVYVISRGNSEAAVDALKAKKESYKKQIEVLRKSHNDEILKRDELEAKYEATLKEVEEKYKQRSTELSNTEKEEIKEVIIKSKGNSSEVKERIEKEFRIKFTN